MKASGEIGSNGVEVSDNVEKRFEPDIYIYKVHSPLFFSKISNEKITVHLMGQKIQ
jgi:DNA-binding protein